MKHLLSLLLITLLPIVPTHAEVKTLSNKALQEKGYERLDGNSQFRLGCRHLVRSADKSIIYRPTLIGGMAIGFNVGEVFYAVSADDKSTLHGSDGSEQAITTWRSCLLL